MKEIEQFYWFVKKPGSRHAKKTVMEMTREQVEQRFPGYECEPISYTRRVVQSPETDAEREQKLFGSTFKPYGPL